MDRETLSIKIEEELKNLEIDTALVEKSKVAFYETNKDTRTCIIAMEEMTELTQALISYLMEEIPSDDLNILEEVVDVRICLEEIIYGFKMNEEAILEKKESLRDSSKKSETETIFVCIREMAELSQILSKFLREKITRNDESILERLVIVDNLLDEIEEVFNLNKDVLQAIVNIKIKRNIERYC